LQKISFWINNQDKDNNSQTHSYNKEESKDLLRLDDTMNEQIG